MDIRRGRAILGALAINVLLVSCLFFSNAAAMQFEPPRDARPTLELPRAVSGTAGTVSSGQPEEESGNDCGTVSQFGLNPPTDAAALQAENCFLAAFQTCQSATLTVASRGVDVASMTTYTVVVDDSGGCQVEGTAVTVAAPRGPRTTTFACEGVAAQDSGLLVQGCDSFGDVTIPSPAAEGGSAG